MQWKPTHTQINIVRASPDLNVSGSDIVAVTKETQHNTSSSRATKNRAASAPSYLWTSLAGCWDRLRPAGRRSGRPPSCGHKHKSSDEETSACSEQARPNTLYNSIMVIDWTTDMFSLHWESPTQQRKDCSMDQNAKQNHIYIPLWEQHWFQLIAEWGVTAIKYKSRAHRSKYFF